MTTTPKKPFHEQVAEKLIQQLKQGTAPWQRPWKPGVSFLPTNLTTGKRYRGINVLQLLSQNRDDNRWMTYEQAKSVGGQVKRGEKGTTIQFWLFTEKQNKVDDNGKPVLDKAGNPVKVEVKLERPKVMHSVVFNAGQIDGLPPQEIRPPVQSWEVIERAEKMLNGSGATLVHSQGDRACYRLSTDSIQLPERTQFDSADKYYSTALHELGHWTGHPSRLDRSLGHPFGSEMYAKEELRAEISSMIMGEELGIGHDTSQHVSYVGSWITVLENDPLEIFRAAADAEKIQTFILGLENNQQILAAKQVEIMPVEKQNEANLMPAISHLLMPKLSQLPENWTGKVGVGEYVATWGPYEDDEEFWADEWEVAIPGKTQPNKFIVWVESGENQKQITVEEYNTAEEAYAVMHELEKYSELRSDLLAAKHLQILRNKPDEDPMKALQEVILQEVLTTTFDFAEVPTNWRGKINVLGCITVNGQPEQANENDIPEFYGLYATDANNTQVWIADYKEFAEAREVASRLDRIHELADGVDLNSKDFLKNRNIFEIIRDELRQTAMITITEKVTAEENIENQHRKALKHEEQIYKQDLDAALALRAYRDNPLEDLRNSLSDTFQDSFQIKIPEDWTGQVSMHACITVDDKGSIDEALGEDIPDFYGLYAYDSSGKQTWLADYATYDEAIDLECRLNRVNEMAKGLDMNSDEFMANSNAVEIVNDLLVGVKHKSEIDANQETIIKDRKYITVPYSEKNEAKELGAKWDKQERSWYVPDGFDLVPFNKWATVAAEQTPELPEELSNGKKYLAVPYQERAEAKAVGAKWDKEAKSWYVEPQAFYENVSKWLPENVETQQDPAMDPREEFRDALSDVGFELDGHLPEMDGKPHRCRVDGDKNSEKSGTYTGYLDGHPAGFMQNHRNGVKENWKSAGVKLDPAQKALLMAEAAGKLQEREAKRLQQYEKTASRVQTKIKKLLKIEGKTPYLEAKGINAIPGIFTDATKLQTFIPAYDSEGKIWTMQRIDGAGTKLFEKGGRKEGCFHVIGGYENLAQSPVIIVSEGYATASSVTDAVGFSTVAAFDAGNLKTVAMALHEKFPDKPLLIAGDDDVHKKVNVGRQMASKAAEAVNGKAVFPIFGEGESTLSNGLTDYNDLATKSKFGKGGIYRQMMPEVISITTDKKNVVQLDERQIQSQRQTAKKAIGH